MTTNEKTCACLTKNSELDATRKVEMIVRDEKRILWKQTAHKDTGFKLLNGMSKMKRKKHTHTECQKRKKSFTSFESINS